MKQFFPALFAITAIHAQDLCKQPPPEEMAKAVGVALPPLPWHVAKVPLKKAHASYPDKGGPDLPDRARVKAEGEDCVVEVGPIFKPDEAGRPHDLTLEGEPLPN